MGRPSSFNDRLVHALLTLAKTGATDEELAAAAGVDVRTLYRWKGAHPDFCQALKAQKDIADDLIVDALYKNGIQGNVTAQIFWLKNRQPDRWRDVSRQEMTGKDGGPIESTAPQIIVTLPDNGRSAK